MQTDFNPVHLKEANEKLDELLSSIEEIEQCHSDTEEKRSLWQRFLGLFQSNPFELPEDLYKYK